MANRYWVGGSGTWNSSSTTHWSASSGGAGGASVPTSADNVFIDANSGSGIVTINGSVNCNNFDCTNSTIGSYNFGTGSDSLNIYGSAVLLPSSGAGAVGTYFRSTTTGNTIKWPTSSGMRPLFFTGSGDWTFLNDMPNQTDYPSLNVNSGTINTNGFAVKIGSLTQSGGLLSLGSSTVTIKSTNWITNPSGISAGTSTIIFDTSSDGWSFSGSNIYYNVQLKSGASIVGGSTFNTLSLYAGKTYTFQPGTTQTISSLVANGSSGSTIKFRSRTPGSTYTLNLATSGVATVSYADIEDCAAIGTNTPINDRTGGVNSGNNTGWSFGFLDSAEGGATGGGAVALIKTKATIAIGEVTNGGGKISTSLPFQALPGVDYEYRVFDKDFNYLGIWKNVTSDPNYDQSLNQNATELQVQIARSPDNRTVSYDTLEDNSSSLITDENGSNIIVQTATANSVGPGTDIQENLNVDVYKFYGGYDALQDENGNNILDTNNDEILSQYGYPNGKRIYSGYIVDYDLLFGDQTGVVVTIVPHATETSHYIFKDGSGHTTVSYLAGTDPVQMARDAMDNYNSQRGTAIITYDSQSMPLSGESGPAYDFKLQTTRESIDQTVNMLPSGYYQFVDPGERKQYLLQQGSSADHTFYYEKHLHQLNLKKSISQLINKAYYVGGDDGTGSSVYTYDEDVTSIGTYRPGLDRLADSRVKDTAAAHLLAQQQISEYKTPRYITSVTISDAVYDIETIKLGQMVAFKNFANFVDNLLLQIVTVHKMKHSITLDLDMIVPTDTKRLYELKKSLQSQVIENIPVTPSL